MSRAVYDLTACVPGRSSGVRPIATFLKSEPSPGPGSVLVIFIHGYNNDRLTNEERMSEILSNLRRHVRADLESDVVSFTWPANLTSTRWISGASYPWKVGVADDSGDALAAALRQLRSRGMVRVRLIAHSLGCLVALQAARGLKGTGVVVEDLVLLGAAVPEGLCARTGPFEGPLARREHVLFSRQDEILGGKAFSLGQSFAVLLRRQQGLPRGRSAAVGLLGGPSGRWEREVEPRAVTHTGYWSDREVVKTVAPYLFRPVERRPRVRLMSSARPRIHDASTYRVPSRKHGLARLHA